MTRMLHCTALVAFTLAALSLSALGHAEDAASLSRVLAPFAKVDALEAHFREEKRIALLAKPLESEGDLYYARPYQLARHTATPIASTLVVQKDRLTMIDDTGAQHLDLEGQPEVAALVDALMLIFEGNAERLKALMHYELSFDGERFQLKLRPREEKLAKLIREMTVVGKGAQLETLRIVDGFGDESVTTFDKVTIRDGFSADERARLFRVNP